MFNEVYRGKRILITGHTGFKGSWLAFWLQKLGAELCGIALPPETNPNHFNLLKLDFRSEYADIREAAELRRIIHDFQPEIVFHLAAQALVLRSYQEPLETMKTNVLGTANVLEVCRTCASVRAIVVVSSDKCYENREWVWGYRENEAMGGYDPYSASKGCTELLVNCWRQSFFHPEEYGHKHQVLLASARSGNVIGGGDWAEDRLVPDLMKAAAAGTSVTIRRPQAVRPWQHVLEPLSGYLLLAQQLHEGRREFAEAWNFGPAETASCSVEETAQELAACWNDIAFKLEAQPNAPHEAGLLRLDCSKAHSRLQWHPVWNRAETFHCTAEWYRRFYRENQVSTEKDLATYCLTASKQGLIWSR
ncbi:MAG: CDP-glucose 4,6-dehydratase [Lentisphaeria bacterium]